MTIYPVSGYGTQRFIVSTTAGQGTHTSLASAMAAASAGDTIILRSSVTENVTLTPGVNISAWTSSGYAASGTDANISITGKLTMTSAGSSTISGIQLITNSDYCVSMTGTNASILNFIDCYFYGTNHTCINFDNTGSDSYLYLIDCYGNITESGATLLSGAGNGTVEIRGGEYHGSGTAMSMSAGDIFMYFVTTYIGFTQTGTNTVNIYHSQFRDPDNGISLGGSGGYFYGSCYIETDATPCLTLGAGTTTKVDFIDVAVDTGYAITGSGDLYYGIIAYTGTGSTTNSSNLIQVTMSVLDGANGGTGVSNSGLTINLGSATSGYVLTSDSSGNGTWQAASGGSGFTSINQKIITTTGSYTPSSGMVYCIVQAVGGGGGGGGTGTCPPGQYAAAGGGGSGELAYGIFSAATIGASQTATIGAAGAAGVAGDNTGGAGGTTSLGSLLSAIGGSGGGGGTPSTAFSSSPGGIGGTGGTVANYNIPGQQGGYSLYQTPTNIIQGGGGGNSPLGGGGAIVNTGGDTGGTSPVSTAYGAGGSGGNTVASGGQQAGGAGAQGVIIITEFI